MALSIIKCMMNGGKLRTVSSSCHKVSLLMFLRRSVICKFSYIPSLPHMPSASKWLIMVCPMKCDVQTESLRLFGLVKSPWKAGQVRYTLHLSQHWFLAYMWEMLLWLIWSCLFIFVIQCMNCILHSSTEKAISPHAIIIQYIPHPICCNVFKENASSEQLIYTSMYSCISYFWIFFVQSSFNLNDFFSKESTPRNFLLYCQASHFEWLFIEESAWTAWFHKSI